MPGSQDAEPTPVKSWGLFEIAVLFLVFSGPPTFRRRDPMASLAGQIDLAAAMQLAVWLLAGIWVAMQLLALKKPGWRPASIVPPLPTPVWGGLVLAMLLAFSSFTSPSPALSALRSIQMAIAVLMAYFTICRHGISGSLVFVRRGLAILGYAIFACVALRPDLVLRPGPYFGIHGNTVAPAPQVGMMLFILVILWPFPPLAQSGGGRITTFFLDRRAVLALESVSLVILARSRVGIAMLVTVTMIVVVLVAPRWAFWRRLGLLAAALVGVILASVNAQTVVGWVLRDPNQLRNLSHRIPLWSHLTSAVMNESPLFGLGFISSSRVLGPEAVPKLANAHSAFVEVLVGGGLVAGVLFVTLWLWLITKAVAASFATRPRGLTLPMLSIVLLAFALTTSHQVYPGPPSFVFWLVVAALSASSKHGDASRAD